MNIQISTKALNNALITISRSLPARPVMPVYAGILVEAKQNNEVVLTASDGNSARCCATVPANVTEPGEVIVLAEKFRALVSKMTENQITFTANGNTARLMYGENGAKIPVITGEYGSFKTDDSTPVKFDRERLSNALRGVVYAAAVDAARVALTGVYCKVTPTCTTIVAIDGFRLAKKTIWAVNELPGAEGDISVLIPGKSVSEIIRLLDSCESAEEIVLNCGKKTVTLATEGITYETTLLDTPYIDYERLIPIESVIQLTLNKERLQEAIDRVQIFAEKGSPIKMTLKNGELFVSYSGQEGSLIERMPVAGTSQEISIGMNPKYLSDALKHMPAGEIVMKINEKTTPILFSEKGSDDVNMILPVRLLEASKSNESAA